MGVKLMTYIYIYYALLAEAGNAFRICRSTQQSLMNRNLPET